MNRGGKRVFEWCLRVLLVLVSIGISLVIVELLLEKCFAKPIRNKINPEPYEFKIDSHGFRINSKDKTYSTAAGEYFRIICLGDSFTFGHGVSDEETYPFLLEQRLNNFFKRKTQVINAGVCGATIDGELRMYIGNCVNFEHRLVLLLHHPGDVFQLMEGKDNPNIVNVSDRGIGENIRKTKTMQLLIYIGDNWKKKAIARKVQDKAGARDPTRDFVYDKYFRYLKDLDKKVRLENARLAVIFYEPEERIANFCLANAIPVIDISKEHDRQEKIENLFLVNHHNKRGNEFLARQIADRLINSGFIDRK